jgi:hypothetical protein
MMLTCGVQGDTLAINVMDDLTDNTMLTSTSIVRQLLPPTPTQL